MYSPCHSFMNFVSTTDYPPSQAVQETLMLPKEMLQEAMSGPVSGYLQDSFLSDEMVFQPLREEVICHLGSRARGCTCECLRYDMRSGWNGSRC